MGIVINHEDLVEDIFKCIWEKSFIHYESATELCHAVLDNPEIRTIGHLILSALMITIGAQQFSLSPCPSPRSLSFPSLMANWCRAILDLVCLIIPHYRFLFLTLCLFLFNLKKYPYVISLNNFFPLSC